MFLEIYVLDPACFLTISAALKNTKLKLDLLTDINMLEKSIREGICHAIHWHAKANKK